MKSISFFDVGYWRLPKIPLQTQLLLGLGMHPIILDLSTRRFEISLVIPIPSGMYIGIEQDLKLCVIKNEKNLIKVRFITINRPQKLTESPMNTESQRILKNLKFFVVFFSHRST
jgi:hypothetical protein